MDSVLCDVVVCSTGSTTTEKVTSKNEVGAVNDLGRV